MRPSQNDTDDPVPFSNIQKIENRSLIFNIENLALSNVPIKRTFHEAEKLPTILQFRPAE
jgi:hypothetical protein